MTRKIYDSTTDFSVSPSFADGLSSDFFSIQNFGFAKFSVNEIQPSTYYSSDQFVEERFFILNLGNGNSGDFNGDGLEDLVVAPALQIGTIPHPETIIEPMIFLQTPDGGFIDPAVVSGSNNFPSMHSPYRTGVGDFNGDGISDFAVAATPISEGINTASFTSTHELPLVGFGTIENRLNPSQDFSGLTPDSYGYGHSLAMGDFNGDGLDDFASNRTIFYSQPSGIFEHEFYSVTPVADQQDLDFYLSLASGDMNNDGYDDLVVSPGPSNTSDELNASLFLVFGSNGGLLHADPLGINNENRFDGLSSGDNRLINFIDVIDFNGDGNEDLLFVESKGRTDGGDSSDYYSDGFIRLYIGQGDGTFSETLDSIIDPHFQNRHGEGEIFVRDLNGDGWDDFVLNGYWPLVDETGGIPPTPKTSIFVNSLGRFSAVEPDDLVYVDSYQISGFEYTSQSRGIAKMIPVDIGDDGLVDFVSFVNTPILEWPQQNPIFTYAYSVRSLSPLGRPQQNETLLGTQNDDRIFGYDGNDYLIGSSGVDQLNGGDGIDTVVYSGSRLTMSRSDDQWQVAGDTLTSIERVEFTDRNIALDLDGSAGLTAKTLAAVIGEDGLANKEYVGIGLQLFDAGQSLASVCELALTAVGATTNEDVVNLLYTNLYGEAPTAEVAQPFIDALNNGEYSKGVLASAAAELTDDLGVIDLVGLAETGIEYV